jgi:hypothetical protein
MQAEKITNMYEHSIPIWDEAEKTQSIKKIAHKIETVAKVPKI